jgi:hypothetical protein
VLGSSRNFFSGFYTYKSQVSRAVIKFLRKHQSMTRPNPTSRSKLYSKVCPFIEPLSMYPKWIHLDEINWTLPDANISLNSWICWKQKVDVLLLKQMANIV